MIANILWAYRRPVAIALAVSLLAGYAGYLNLRVDHFRSAEAACRAEVDAIQADAQKRQTALQDASAEAKATNDALRRRLNVYTTITRKDHAEGVSLAPTILPDTMRMLDAETPSAD